MNFKAIAGIYIKLCAVLTFVFWILGCLPFLLLWAGVDYVPAPDLWIPIPAWSHWVIGAVIVAPFAGWMLVLVFTGFSWERPFSSLTWLFAPPFGIWMTGFCVNMTLGGTLPMLHTALFGEAGVIEYTVTNPRGANSHYEACYNGIEVNTKVFGLSNICGFSYANRKELRKGTRIEVTGRVSKAGVFYKSYTVVE